MAARPDIAPEQWIRVGKKKAVVSRIYEDRHDDSEVVYLDGRNRAVYAEVTWTGTAWEFLPQESAGRYAEKEARLRPFVHILHADSRYGRKSMGAGDG